MVMVAGAKGAEVRAWLGGKSKSRPSLMQKDEEVRRCFPSLVTPQSMKVQKATKRQNPRPHNTILLLSKIRIRRLLLQSNAISRTRLSSLQITARD